MDTIAALLEKKGYPCQVESLDMAPDRKFITADLPADEEGRDLKLIVQPAHGMLMEMGGLDSTIRTIDMISLFPFSPTEETVIDLMRAAELMNKQMEIPGLGVSEPDLAFYFRYPLLCHGDKIDEAALLAGVTIIETALGFYGPVLEEVASGEKSLSELVEEAIAAAEEEG